MSGSLAEVHLGVYVYGARGATTCLGRTLLRAACKWLHHGRHGTVLKRTDAAPGKQQRSSVPAVRAATLPALAAPSFGTTHALEALASLLVSLSHLLSSQTGIPPVAIHDESDVVGHGAEREYGEQDCGEEGMEPVEDPGDRV